MGRKIQSIGKYKFCYETLGKGSFARVELVIHEVTKCKVAMKIINTRKITEDYIRNNLYREARILSQLNHPNIIKFYESLRADVFYCLITECAQGGDLGEYMKTFDFKRFPESVARYYLRQLISAIQYMHEKGVVHRDLKMENLMLDKTKRHLKLIDFGLSNNLPRNDLLSTHCGSPEYAAPELFTPNALYGPEVDIWSFGIVLYACVTGDLPFFSPYYDHARRQRLLLIINKGLTIKHTKEMEHLSTECKDLIKEVLEPLPQLRIPMDEIINHRWVTNCDQLPFTPYFPKPKPPELKSQIIEKLSEYTSLNKAEIERFVHENGTNELSAMFKMLLEETKVEMGYYEEDHTNRPLSVVNERKRQLARLKWRKLRYRLKESARIFRELVNSKQQSNGAGKSESFDNKDKMIVQVADLKPNKVKPKQRVNPVGIVKTEKKKDFFPPKRSAMQPAISVESNRSLNQLKQIRSRIPQSDSTSNQISLPVLSDPSPKRCNSLVPSQRKVTSNPPNLQNDLSCSSKDISRSQRLLSTDKISQSFAAGEASHKPTYRNNQKNINADLPKVPLANINEVFMDNLEMTSVIDYSEPRYCLVKVTESDMSSGLLISSTISEISEGKSLNSFNIDVGMDNLEVNDPKFDDTTTDSGTPTTIVCSQNNNHHLCNGDIPSNSQTLDDFS